MVLARVLHVYVHVYRGTHVYEYTCTMVLPYWLCHAIPVVATMLSTICGRACISVFLGGNPYATLIRQFTCGQLDQQRIPQTRDGCSRIPIVHRGGQVAPRAGWYWTHPPLPLYFYLSSRFGDTFTQYTCVYVHECTYTCTMVHMYHGTR
jgi:hypothetical protein